MTWHYTVHDLRVVHLQWHEAWYTMSWCERKVIQSEEVTTTTKRNNARIKDNKCTSSLSPRLPNWSAIVCTWFFTSVETSGPGQPRDFNVYHSFTLYPRDMSSDYGTSGLPIFSGAWLLWKEATPSRLVQLLPRLFSSIPNEVWILTEHDPLTWKNKLCCPVFGSLCFVTAQNKTQGITDKSEGHFSETTNTAEIIQ